MEEYNGRRVKIVIGGGGTSPRQYSTGYSVFIDGELVVKEHSDKDGAALEAAGITMQLQEGSIMESELIKKIEAEEAVSKDWRQFPRLATPSLPVGRSDKCIFFAVKHHGGNCYTWKCSLCGATRTGNVDEFHWAKTVA